MREPIVKELSGSLHIQIQLNACLKICLKLIKLNELLSKNYLKNILNKKSNILLKMKLLNYKT